MADPAAPPRPRRLWRVVLVISLALNVAVIGLVAGAALRNDRVGPPRSMDMSLGPIGAALSRDDRRAILADVRETTDLRAARRGPELNAVAEALTAVPFSPDALEQIMTDGQARRDAVVRAAMQAFVTRVTEMSDAERAAFATRMSENRKKESRGPKRDD